MSAIVRGEVKINGVPEAIALAKHLARARGFVPKSLLGDEGGIAAAILTGIELGIGPMEALRSLHVIDGRVTMAADFMLARALRAGVRVTWLRSDTEIASVRMERTGAAAFELAFSMKDAERAGLAGKDNWRKSPAAMLRARAISAAVRAYCPDLLGAGIYTPEELGAVVREDGEPIDVTGEPVRSGPARETVVEHEPRHALPPPADTRSVRDLALEETRTDEELAEWLHARKRHHGNDVFRGRALDHASKIGVSDRDVKAWLGMLDPAPDPDEQGGESDGDPAEGEVAS